MREITKIVEYTGRNESINEILFTGGDPMVMSPSELESYIDVLISSEGGFTPEESRSYLQKLKTEKRYQMDLY